MNRTHGKMRKYLIPLILLLGSSNALALQILEATEEGVIHHARFSRDEMTRLAIQGGRISSMHFPDGRLTVEKDDEQGYAVIRARDDKPVSLVLTTDSGQTHSIFLTPSTMGMDTILIKEKKTVQVAAANGSGAGGMAEPQAKAVKRLVLAMAREEKDLLDYMVEPVNSSIDLWQETHFNMVDKYTGPDMVGYRFLLTNVSGQSMRLGEQEFYKQGVVAVAIDRHVLAPGEKTYVFVIMVRNG